MTLYFHSHSSSSVSTLGRDNATIIQFTYREMAGKTSFLLDNYLVRHATATLQLIRYSVYVIVHNVPKTKVPVWFGEHESFNHCHNVDSFSTHFEEKVSSQRNEDWQITQVRKGTWYASINRAIERNLWFINYHYDRKWGMHDSVLISIACVLLTLQHVPIVTVPLWHLKVWKSGPYNLRLHIFFINNG